jgi:hypothetical protein
MEKGKNSVLARDQISDPFFFLLVKLFSRDLPFGALDGCTGHILCFDGVLICSAKPAGLGFGSSFPALLFSGPSL